MTTLEGFTRVGEVTADSRSRVTLGKAVHPSDRYFVLRNDAGEVLLTPAASIPARELDVWNNPELLSSILTGLRQAANGEAVRTDPFAGLNLDDDEGDG